VTPTTILHRQVSPGFLVKSRVTSQVFRPTPKDNGKLSVADGDQISAVDSWKHFTTELEFDSVGVLSVAFSECQATGLGVAQDPPPPWHFGVDFCKCTSRSQIEKAAKTLLRFAEDRGWQYQP